METLNLNRLTIPVEGERNKSLDDFSIHLANPKFETIEAIFKNQEKRLLEIISSFEKGAIFGCIAWLTSKSILKALAKCETVQIIVQKEDFLRPDLDTKNVELWKVQLWKLYKAINCKMERHQFREPMGNLSVFSDPTVEGIRCVGNHNQERKAAFPRAHHKFLVFCELDQNENYSPVALWTGSFNFTQNASNSFENVLYLVDKAGNNEIINAYLKEHHQIFSLSEQLNWSERWAAPQHRIGT